MKKLLFTFLVICFSVSLKAQQETLLSQYRSQMSLFNPAVAGVNDASKLTMLHRRQWANVAMSPITTSLTYGLNAGKNVGLGVSIISDKVFIEQSTFVSVDYSYRLQLDDISFLYLGIKAGGNFYALNTANLNTFNVVADPSINSISFFMPNIGFGAYYTRGDFYFSLSVPRVLNTERTKTENGRVTTATDRPHLYTSFGVDFLISKESNVTLQPSILSRLVAGAPNTIDANIMVNFDSRLSLGATYRNNDSYAGILQMPITKEIRVGLAYETARGNEITVAGNSFEMLLSYQF